jgi:hypothetical protein
MNGVKTGQADDSMFMVGKVQKGLLSGLSGQMMLQYLP